MHINEFYKNPTVDSDFDELFYAESYPETKDFYQPYCEKNGISERKRLYFHWVMYGQNAGKYKNELDLKKISNKYIFKNFQGDFHKTIEKIFFINLNDKHSLYDKFIEIVGDLNNIERIEAIDTRDKVKEYAPYNLKLDPVHILNKIYFSQSYGAFGCFLSHYKIWKNIIDNNINFALILEEDANYNDVKNFISNYHGLEKKFDFVQINTRCKHPTLDSLCLHFNGTESYLISKSAAKKLINLTHDHSLFNNLVRPRPWEGHKDYRVLIQDRLSPNAWSERNTVTAPVDKFIGYCATPELMEYGIKIKVIPTINLHDEESQKSTVTNIHGPLYPLKSDVSVIEFMQTENYEWWLK